MRLRRFVGWSAGLGFLAALVFVWACVDVEGNSDLLEHSPPPKAYIPQSFLRAVDVLFVIDNSSSMANEQANLQSQFISLANALKYLPGGMPDVHIGVISSDLGVGSYTAVRFCETVGGDRGILGRTTGMDRGEGCVGPGQRYIVDVAPAECAVERDATGFCVSHECAQQHCDVVAEGGETLTLTVDDAGCPRCRNYTGSLTETFSCLAALGTNGCGFEQPLEAMYKALDVQNTPENDGFLREDAYLAVIVIADEDDCSAAQPDVLFDPDPALDSIDSELGYLHSFRCFEFGVTCDVNDRAVSGPRYDCSLREDEDGLLHEISRYTAFLETIKDPENTVVAAIAGPVQDAVVVQRDTQDRPEIKPSCVDAVNEGASPGIRLEAFVSHFNSASDLTYWAYTSVCSSDYAAALQGIGREIGDAMAEKCPVQPYAGCREGPAGTLCRPCLPDCEVFDIEGRNSPDEQTLEVPWCKHVCRIGLCTSQDMQPCEYDENGKCTCSTNLAPTRFEGQEHCAPLLYPESPDPALHDRDPRLLDLIGRREPTCSGPQAQCAGRAAACWYMSAETICNHGAGFRIIRGEEPPPRTYAEVRCDLTSLREVQCDDGRDNDEDCLLDGEDPDCD